MHSSLFPTLKAAHCSCHYFITEDDLGTMNALLTTHAFLVAFRWCEQSWRQVERRYPRAIQRRRHSSSAMILISRQTTSTFFIERSAASDSLPPLHFRYLSMPDPPTPWVPNFLAQPVRFGHDAETSCNVDGVCGYVWLPYVTLQFNILLAGAGG